MVKNQTGQMLDMIRRDNLPSGVTVKVRHGGPRRELVRRWVTFAVMSARAQGYMKGNVKIIVKGNGRRSTQFNRVHSVSHDGHAAGPSYWIEFWLAACTRTQDLYDLMQQHLSHDQYRVNHLGIEELGRTIWPSAHQMCQPQLGIIWAMPPAPRKPKPKKLTLVERRAKAAAKQLATWKRRAAMAKTKVAHYQKRVKYYAKKGVAQCGGSSSP